MATGVGVGDGGVQHICISFHASPPKMEQHTPEAYSSAIFSRAQDLWSGRVKRGLVKNIKDED